MQADMNSVHLIFLQETALSAVVDFEFTYRGSSFHNFDDCIYGVTVQKGSSLQHGNLTSSASTLSCKPLGGVYKSYISMDRITFFLIETLGIYAFTVPCLIEKWHVQWKI